MRKLIGFIVSAVLIAAAAAVVIFWPHDKAPQPEEPKTLLAGILVPLPEGWEVQPIAGGVIAHGSPCRGAVYCKSIMVLDETKLTANDWKKTLVDLKCTDNRNEAPGPLTPRGTKEIGDRGAFYYTVALCGVSNTEIMAIWETQIPKRLVVAPVDPRYGMTDTADRLKRAHWK